MTAVAHVEPEQQGRRLIVDGFDVDVMNIAERGGNAAGYLGEQANPIQGPHPNLRLELSRNPLAPVHRNPLCRLLAKGRDIVAIVAMHDHASPAGHVADDAVARYRATAARVGHHQPFRTGDFERFALYFGVVFLAQLLGKHAGHHRRQTFTEPKLLVDFVHRRYTQFPEQAPPLNLSQPAKVQRVGSERLAQELFAQFARFIPLQVLQIGAYGIAGLARGDEIDPVGAGARRTGRDDLHGVPIAERGIQRDFAPGNLCGDTAIADVGMHGIGEIHGGRAPGKAHDVALGCEHVDLVGEQVRLDGIEKLLGIGGLLHLHQVLQPIPGPGLGPVRQFVHGLVLPMRGDAAFGHLVHLFGPYLDLQRHALGTEQRRVQGLVAIDPGD